MEWALELALSYNKPVAATMCIGPRGVEKVEPGTIDHWPRAERGVAGNQRGGVRGADGAGRGEDHRGQLLVRSLHLPRDPRADEGRAGGGR